MGHDESIETELNKNKDDLIKIQEELEISERANYIYFIGIISAVCLIIAFVSSYDSSKGVLEQDFNSQFLLAIGASGITGLLVAYYAHRKLSLMTAKTSQLLLERNIYKLRRLIDRFGNDVAGMDNKLEEINTYITYDILMNDCKDSKITRIFGKRDNGELKNQIEKAIEPTETKTIRLLGTTHRDFFKTKGRGSNDNGYLPKLKEFVKTQRDVKILLSNPYSEEGIKRTLLEEARKKNGGLTPEQYIKKFKSHPQENYKHSQTWKDVNNVLDTYEGEFLKGSCNKYNIELKFYDDFPSLWLIITDKKVFFQPYQYGTLPGDIQDIGLYFFIMLLEIGVNYSLLLNHFDFMWNKDTNLSFDKMHTLFNEKGAEPGKSEADKTLNTFIKKYQIIPLPDGLDFKPIDR